MAYDPKVYWEERLQKNFNCVGVGHIGMSSTYNEMIYRVRKYRLAQFLKKQGIQVKGARVLDIGCGTGFFAECYKQWGVQDLVGVDITQTSIDNMMPRYPDFTFHHQD